MAAIKTDYSAMSKEELQKVVEKQNSDLPLLLELAETVGYTKAGGRKAKTMHFESGSELTMFEYNQAKRMYFDRQNKLNNQLVKLKTNHKERKGNNNGAMGFTAPRAIGDATLGFFCDPNTDLGTYPNSDGVELPLREHFSCFRDNTGYINTQILTALYRIYANRNNLSALATHNKDLPVDKHNRQYLGADDQMNLWFGQEVFGLVRAHDTKKKEKKNKDFVDGEIKPKALLARTQKMEKELRRYEQLPPAKKALEKRPSDNINDYLSHSDTTHLFKPDNFQSYHFNIFASVDQKSEKDYTDEIALQVGKPEGVEKQAIDRYYVLCEEATALQRKNLEEGIESPEKDFAVIALQAVKDVTGSDVSDETLQKEFPKLNLRAVLDYELVFVRTISRNYSSPKESDKPAVPKRPVLPVNRLMRSPSPRSRRAALASRASTSVNDTNGDAPRRRIGVTAR